MAPRLEVYSANQLGAVTERGLLRMQTALFTGDVRALSETISRV
jgi:hypothetical protein